MDTHYLMNYAHSFDLIPNLPTESEGCVWASEEYTQGGVYLCWP